MSFPAVSLQYAAWTLSQMRPNDPLSIREPTLRPISSTSRDTWTPAEGVSSTRDSILTTSPSSHHRHMYYSAVWQVRNECLYHSARKANGKMLSASFMKLLSLPKYKLAIIIKWQPDMMLLLAMAAWDGILGQIKLTSGLSWRHLGRCILHFTPHLSEPQQLSGCLVRCTGRGITNKWVWERWISALSLIDHLQTDNLSICGSSSSPNNWCKSCDDYDNYYTSLAV